MLMIKRDDGMNDLKRELCNYLIKNNMVKEYDVIKHSYTNARFNDWKTRNIECNNISPTLDTRCDCLGVVIKEEVDMEKDINVIGNYSPSGHNASRSDNQIKSIREWKAYEKPLENMEKTDNNQYSPTLTTRSGAYAAGMVLLKDEYHGMFQYNKSDQFMKSKDRLTKDKELADCLVTYPKEGVVLIKNATKQGYLEAEEGDGIDISSRMQHHRGTVQKESTQTITTKGGNDIGVIIKENKWEDLD